MGEWVGDIVVVTFFLYRQLMHDNHVEEAASLIQSHGFSHATSMVCVLRDMCDLCMQCVIYACGAYV